MIVAFLSDITYKFLIRWLIHQSGILAWSNITNDYIDNKVIFQISKLARYEDWKGNNHFFCNGRYMLGSDARFFWFVFYHILYCFYLCT